MKKLSPETWVIILALAVIGYFVYQKYYNYPINPVTGGAL